MRFIKICIIILGALPVLEGHSFSEVKAEIYKSCFECHGHNGNSTIAIYPSIAGLPKNQLFLKLKEYRDNKVQNPKADIMSPVVEGLSDAELEVLADYFSRQIKTEPQQRRRRGKED